MSTRSRVLLLRVCAELGAGNITEGYITSKDEYCEGLTQSDGAITINPTHAVVDAVIHECLHRMFWRWSEAKVRGHTRQLRRLMTDDETQAFYKEYKKRVRVRTRAKRA